MLAIKFYSEKRKVQLFVSLSLVILFPCLILFNKYDVQKCLSFGFILTYKEKDNFRCSPVMSPNVPECPRMSPNVPRESRNEKINKIQKQTRSRNKLHVTCNMLIKLTLKKRSIFSISKFSITNCAERFPFSTLQPSDFPIFFSWCPSLLMVNFKIVSVN